MDFGRSAEGIVTDMLHKSARELVAEAAELVTFGRLGGG